MARGYCRPRGNNRWQLEVDLGSYVDPDTGKRKRLKKYRTITAKGAREAERELIKFVAEVTNESYAEPKKISFYDFVIDHWLPKCAEERLAHTTLNSYINRIETRILPAFKYFRLDQVKPMHIVDFLSNLKEDGMRLDGKKGKLSSASIRFYHRILKHIFDFAVEVKFLKENPVKNVKRPKEENKEIDVYSTEEIIKLLEALETETEFPHWQVIIKLAVTTGMRRSELYGLEFKHIDLDKRIIHVRQALTYSKEKGFQIHEIKKGSRTAKKRDIVLSNALIEPIRRLKLLRRQQQIAIKKEDRWQEGKYDLLLCHSDGRPFHPSAIRSWWIKFIERHNLKYINIHALRHTSATLLINEGVHPKVISERLGHSDIKTTMNTYGHVLKKANEMATEKMDDVLFKNSKTH